MSIFTPLRSISVIMCITVLCLNAGKPDLCNRAPTRDEQKFIAATAAAYYREKHAAVRYDIDNIENGYISGTTYGPYYQKGALNHIIQQFSPYHGTFDFFAYYTYMGGEHIIKSYKRPGKIMRFTRKQHPATPYIHEAAQQVLGEHYLEISRNNHGRPFSLNDARTTVCQLQPYITEGYIDSLVAEIHRKMRFMDELA